MSKRVLVAVVTFNRLGWLKNLVAALENQTFKDLSILVVDNASTDGTKEWCGERQDGTSFKYLRMESNTGGAGGFSRSVTAFLEDHESEWLWMMDDDAEPLPDCLATMMNRGGEYPAMVPRILDPDGSLQFRVADSVMRNDAEFRGVVHRQDDFRAEMDVYSYPLLGVLARRDLVEKVGTVDASFFIQADDLDWTLRLSELHAIRYVPDARMYHHEDVRMEVVRIMGMTRHQLPKAGVWKLYYGLRNQAIVRHRRGTFRLLQYTKNVLSTFVWRMPMAGRWQTAVVCSKAFWHGWRNITGRLVEPGYGK